ncbi:RsiV family protein [Necropsobacter massiliensis]|uniref:RsiV family protein n=1 Tax=Necropsobacter massiliensis TaxID=1400001 RepID=UPI0006617920|nr:RsiV family protein [Necropsobacter massiliensis]
MPKSVPALLIIAVLLSACHDEEASRLQQQLRQSQQTISRLQAATEKAQTELTQLKADVPALQVKITELFNQQAQIEFNAKAENNPDIAQATVNTCDYLPETGVQWLDNLLIKKQYGYLINFDEKSQPESDNPGKADLIKLLESIHTRAVNEIKQEPTPGFDLCINANYLGQRQNVVSFEEALSTYNGGAHGMHYLFYTNIDINKKAIIGLDDLVVTGARPRLTEFLWKDYIDNVINGEPPFIAKEDFHISPQFYFSPEGIHFVYPPYALNAYAYGDVTLILPWGAIEENLINPDYNWYK